MRKKAVKNFVYSFLFSLLAVAAVGKVFSARRKLRKTKPETRLLKRRIYLCFQSRKT